MSRRLVLDLKDARPLWAPPAWVAERLAAALPAGWQLVHVGAPADGTGDGGAGSAEALAAVQGAEVYFGYGITPALFEAAAGRLRWVHSAAAGVGGSLFDAMRHSDVVLTNSAGVHAEPMADTVLAMLLHFARGLDLAVAAQRERRWASDAFDEAGSPVLELADATVGVVGYGGIGRAVARRAHALGCRVVASRRAGADGDGDGIAEVRAGPGALRWVLRESDFVVVTLPLTAETRGAIGAESLRSMRPGAVLVNVGRGGVVDEDALLDALQTGRLRGAALDVAATEPLPRDSPLWRAPNLLLTPHVSATTRKFWPRQVDLMERNLLRYLDGRPLLNVVDKHAGY
jgi:phosphoglycerate dehydrogenase-like enzyme